MIEHRAKNNEEKNNKQLRNKWIAKISASVWKCQFISCKIFTLFSHNFTLISQNTVKFQQQLLEIFREFPKIFTFCFLSKSIFRSWWIILFKNLKFIFNIKIIL